MLYRNKCHPPSKLQFFRAINGDIFKNCVGERATFSEEESKELTRQLAQALDFIHKRYIVHLDVKPQNILLAQGSRFRSIQFSLGFPKMKGIYARFHASHDIISLTLEIAVRHSLH